MVFLIFLRFFWCPLQITRVACQKKKSSPHARGAVVRVGAHRREDDGADDLDEAVGVVAAEELVAAFPRTPTQCALRIAPTTALLLESAASPAYEFRNPTKSRSKHETLFWFGREGPGLLVWLMRVQMLLCATSLAIISQLSLIHI